MQQTSSSLNSSNVNDTYVKGTIEKGKIMFQNSAISQEYVTFKIDTLSKYVNELEECKKYLIDQEKVGEKYLYVSYYCISHFLTI